MGKPPTSIQDVYLNQVRKEHVPVIIYLVNGVQLRTDPGLRNFTVLLENEGK